MTNSHSPSSADSTYEQLAEARIARQGRMLGRLRKAIKPFVDIGLARDHDQSAPDMIEAVDLAITPTHVREAREAHQNLDTDIAPSAAAASLTERLIQAAVDYESGRCSRKELSQVRAAVEAAITGTPAQPAPATEGAIAQTFLDEDYQELDSYGLARVMLKHWDVRWNAAQPPAAPVETKSAPEDSAPHNSGERLPSSDAATAGADTQCSADNEAAKTCNSYLERALKAEAEVEALKHDIERHIQIATDLANEPQGTWQPMDTAPKDKCILVATAHKLRPHRIAWWSDRQLVQHGNGWAFDGNGFITPLAWQPLPDTSPLSRPELGGK